MEASNVEVATAALLRAWRKAACNELWLQFTPRRPGDFMADVANAIGTANDAFDESDVTAGFAFGEGPWCTPIGPPACQAVISRTGYERDVLAWLEIFAAQLSVSGVGGTLTPVPSRDHRSWPVMSDMPLPQLITFFAYTVVDPAPPADRPHEWNVAEAATARIAAEVERAAFPGSETYFSGVGLLIRTEPSAAASALRRSLPRDCITRVTHIRPNPPRVVSVNFYVNGMSARVAYDPGQSWRDRLARSIDAMIALPAHTDLAFVQHSSAIYSTWDGLDLGTPALPELRAYHFRYNPHLLSRFVPDARGALLLTDAHLERARDLSDWSIRAVGHGRHLVQAKDLAAWYEQPDPDPATLAKARTDFGEMILTLAAIERNPPPQPTP